MFLQYQTSTRRQEALDNSTSQHFPGVFKDFEALHLKKDTFNLIDLYYVWISVLKIIFVAFVLWSNAFALY